MTNRRFVAPTRAFLVIALIVAASLITRLALLAQPSDTQPPSITFALPAAGATDVAVTVTIRVTFNEPVQTSSVAIDLRDANNVVVAGNLIYDQATRTATFDPSQELQGSQSYQLTVAPATDLAGNSMPSAVQWTFTTALTGFQETVAFSGLVEPTVVVFSPDGRVFVGEKSGLIKVFDSLTDTTPTIFADLRTNVHNFWDRGLLGMVLHPNFPATPYVYVLYTYDAAIGGTAPRWGEPDVSSDDCPTPPGATANGCVVSGRLSRLEAGGNQMVGAEDVLIEDWFQQFPGHSIGALAFGPDGELYVTGGDGASFNYADWGQTGNPAGDPPGAPGVSLSPPTAEGGALRSQDFRTRTDPLGLNGTLIRVDPDTGLGLPDNPLSTDSEENARRLISYGLRTPFRIALRPGTREIWIANTGAAHHEEINRIVDPVDSNVENFGWPCYEGTGPQPAYDAANLNMCEQLYASPGAVTAPYYFYSHGEEVIDGDACGHGSASISGIAFYEGNKFPAAYDGALFFADYARQCIWTILADSNGLPDPSTRASFRIGAPGPVDLKVHDGDLYYVDIFGGTVRRIQYFSGSQPPTAVPQGSPLIGPSPLLVSFDGSDSTDPDGGTLTYSWDLNGDAVFGDATTAQTSFTYTTTGVFQVSLRVTDPQGLSDVKSLTVVTDQLGFPNPVIDTPLASLRWKVGDAIPFSGHATDPDDGTLPASALSWSLLLYHCPGGCHIHPVRDFTGVSAGSFVAPDHEYPSQLVLQLTATDSSGLQGTTSVALQPATVELSFQSSPSGIPLAVFSAANATPFTATLIQGGTVSISASPAYVVGTEFYRFQSWSDGGALTHNIGPVNTNQSYTATYSTPEDITLDATPIAMITAPTGGGSQNLNVIRDGVFPAAGSGDSTQQYDTYSGDPTRSFDWVGHEFGSSHTFVGLTFQEGIEFSNGGWFASLSVQVRSGGVWTDVVGLASSPSYPGRNGVSYEKYALSFEPTTGDAIRIAGLPGGAQRFVSVGELHAIVGDSSPDEGADITSSGMAIASIMQPLGSGNPSLHVIQDGVFPPVGSDDSTQQYDTFTGDPFRTFDWVGYQFVASHVFTGLTFQEGKRFSDGGWFESLNAEVRTNGVWTPVSGLQITPVYSGADPGYERFTLSFAPAVGDAIRIAGAPGGSERFISVGELRVRATFATAQDVTPEGTPIALITSPTGGGNHSLSVIGDGVFPLIGSDDATQQYDTFTGDPFRTCDWVGYEFAKAYSFAGLIFQEGLQSWDGGWFTDLRVQVRSGGVWIDVTGLEVIPVYGGANGITFERYALKFNPATGNAIRLAGAPGGSAHFISVGELRVMASLDVTTQGTPIAMITAPTGEGSRNLSVIADNVFPPAGSSDSTQQYDTFTGDPFRSVDWVGYQFLSTRTFAGLQFVEGKQFWDGGWFGDLKVQVRSNGVWSDVPAAITPAYAGANGLNFDRYWLALAPITGDAIRIAGAPAGSARFISVGELRVIVSTP